MGYDAINDIFAENAWYFRNALVRANYTDLKNDIHETTVYLERLIRNLLLDENNGLKNRHLHINHLFEENTDKKAEINAEIKISEKQKKIILMLKENPYYTIK